MRGGLVGVDTAVLIPGTLTVTGVALVFWLAALADRPPERLLPDEHGIMPCPAAAQQDLLSFRALHCWFAAPAGHWRVVSRVSAHGALVVEAEATDLGQADGIARQFVATTDGRFSEILVYVQPESAADPTTIRRIRWTAQTGFEPMQFTASPAR